MSLRRILRGIQRRRNQIFLSASERQSRELMQKTQQHCMTLNIATRLVSDDWFAGTSFGRLEIALPNGVRIIGLPANPETVRGFTGDVFLDEFAMHADDRAIWAAIFPTLLRGNGELDVASTPKGKSNMFYDLSQNDRFHHSTVTLPAAVEQGLEVDVNEVRSSMSDDMLYRQEFLCEFLDESTAFLTYEQIIACQDPTLDKEVSPDRLADVKGDLFVGVDIGRKRDLTVMWVFERVDQSLVTRAVIERHNLPFRDQYELLCQLMSLRHVRRCCIDAGGLGMQLAESAVEDFGTQRVQPVVFTNALKSELAGKLRIAVEDHRLRIPADDDVRDDWHSIRRSITAAGQLRFEAPRSDTGHADRFWAAALAVHAAGSNAGPQHCLNVRPLAFATSGAW